MMGETRRYLTELVRCEVVPVGPRVRLAQEVNPFSECQVRCTYSDEHQQAEHCDTDQREPPWAKRNRKQYD